MILAHTIKYSVETVLNLHTALGRPMGKACALSVCSLMESLKAIENTYHRHNTLLAESLPHVMQYLTCQILSIIVAAKVRIVMNLFIVTFGLLEYSHVTFSFLQAFFYSVEYSVWDIRSAACCIFHSLNFICECHNLIKCILGRREYQVHVWMVVDLTSLWHWHLLSRCCLALAQKNEDSSPV